MKAAIRMYRHGLGDCFLLQFPKHDGGTTYVMIDCGVILGQPGAKDKVQDVVRDIKTVTNYVDVLIATHEHWDHLSGFIDARDDIKAITFGEVWLGWTENQNDPQARSLKAERNAAISALRVREARLRLFGASPQADELSGFLELYGAAGARTTAEAMNVVRSLGVKGVQFCDPADPPKPLAGTDVKAFIFGPPRDVKLLKTLQQSPKSPEMYGLDASALATADSGAPFDAMQSIPTRIAQQMPFFQKTYWQSNLSGDSADWRRIDGAVSQDAADLALQLDNATNNTSLVVAFQFPDGDVMLFPGDAQIGSWLSWQKLSWTVDDQIITGPELLARTVLYKVGHHGSHNATAKASGLEEMTALRFAMIPVDQAEAHRKGWNRMPLPEIVAALDARAVNGVIRADEAINAIPNTQTAALYHEIQI